MEDDILKPKFLGQNISPATSPDEAEIESVPNPHKDIDYVARFICPEFTSLCPVTNQPDFAHIVIDYIPDNYLAESKSLKLYLHSFRNYGSFHEDCTLKIAKEIIKSIKPRWIRIGGYWYPRGGIPIDVFWQSKSPPDGVWIPSQGVPSYKGRG